MGFIPISGLALTAALTASQTTMAQQSQYDQCIKRTSTNTDWAECGAKAIGDAEAKLTTSWKKLSTCFDSLAKEGPDDGLKAARQDVLTEQRLWIKWKDASCNFYSEGYFGREGQVLGFPQCRLEIVNQRREQIESIEKEFCEQK